MTYAAIGEGSVSTYNSIGLSAVAKQMDTLRNELIASSQETCSSECVEWGLAQSDFVDIVNEAMAEDWDGYGARALIPDAIDAARRFLRALPLYGTPPAISAVPTGFLSFTYQDPKNAKNHIHIIVTPNELHFSYKTDGLEGAAKSPFDVEIPSDVSRLIRRVVQTGR